MSELFSLYTYKSMEEFVYLKSSCGHQVSVVCQTRPRQYCKEEGYACCQWVPRYLVVEYKGEKYYVEVLKSDDADRESKYYGDYKSGRVYVVTGKDKRYHDTRRELSWCEAKDFLLDVFYEGK